MILCFIMHAQHDPGTNPKIRKRQSSYDFQPQTSQMDWAYKKQKVCSSASVAPVETMCDVLKGQYQEANDWTSITEYQTRDPQSSPSGSYSTSSINPLHSAGCDREMYAQQAVDERVIPADDDKWEKSFIGSSSDVGLAEGGDKRNIADLTYKYALSLPTAASLVNLLEMEEDVISSLAEI